MLAKTTFHHRHLKDLKLTKWVASYVDTLWHDLSVGIGIPLGLNPPWLFDTRPLQASGMNVVWRKVCPEKYLKNKIKKNWCRKYFRKIEREKSSNKKSENLKFRKIEKSKFRNFKIFGRFFLKILFDRKSNFSFFSMIFLGNDIFVKSHSSMMHPCHPGVMSRPFGARGTMSAKKNNISFPKTFFQAYFQRFPLKTLLVTYVTTGPKGLSAKLLYIHRRPQRSESHYF